ncbi:1,4-beta-xylanase [Cellvibrio mixtus]|uniref:Beta-xylanase n=1 Tax=Cellvibrio mixtus TaxID=39650 RepID=A0A266QAJ9_9GAMM|nr:endo-1,4-beta-xylanase [Cellvibrio mixtus]OZY86913.1 1,4-beta-xylanase [Cellvibrio mixtus]
MRYIQPILCLSLASLLLSACGGSSNSPSPNNPSSSSLSSSAPSSAAVSSSEVSSTTSASVALSSEAPSSAAQSSEAPSSAMSSSTPAEPTRLTLDMSSGWRGNGPNNSGITYNSDGVAFAPTGDAIGAVTDVFKPIQLENAIIEMVVNVSSEYKTSGANLQIFSQIKGGNWDGEWNCWSGNEQLIANTDVTINCTISEAGKFNQTENDVQVGVQAKGTPAGTVTIKSVTLTLAQAASSSSAQSSSTGSVYSANVTRLQALAAFPIGAAVTNNDNSNFNIVTNTSEQAVVEKHFGEMTAGNIMKMSYLQPGNGNFSFTNADTFVDYAKDNNINVHGHALVWHSDYQVPGFMKNWSGSAADFIAEVEDHVTQVVTHFKAKGNVVSWDVVNEALNDGNPSNFRTTDSTFYVKSGNSSVYIEKAFQAARAADPSATLYYNDYNIDQNNAKTTKLIEMITDFQTREIPIDGVGFQMHVFMDYPSIASISAAMKKVVDKGLKVKITELDVAVNNPYSGGWPGNKITSFTNTVALAQQKRYCEIVKAYMDTVPAAQRGGISVWGTTDANTWLTTATAAYNGEAIAWPLLFDNNYNDKPALRGFADGLQGAACN